MRLSLEKLGHAEYQWEECAKRFIVCTKFQMAKKFYNLNDPVQVKELVDMGFVLRVREKVGPL